MHVMVDIETLGTRPGSAILSIGACAFDETGIGERFYRPIDLFDSLMCGLTVDEATIGFWRLQSDAARRALRPSQPLEIVLDQFRMFLSGATTGAPPMLWAKGPDFDLVMLARAYALLDKKQPWSYRNTRDVRTILALAPGVSQAVERAGTAHHALDDAVYQAQAVIEAAKQLDFPLSEMA